MDDLRAPAVEVAEGPRRVLRDVEGALGVQRDPALVQDPVQRVGQVLEDRAEVGGLAAGPQELDDVWMAKAVQDRDLAAEVREEIY